MPPKNKPVGGGAGSGGGTAGSAGATATAVRAPIVAFAKLYDGMPWATGGPLQETV